MYVVHYTYAGKFHRTYILKNGRNFLIIQKPLVHTYIYILVYGGTRRREVYNFYTLGEQFLVPLVVKWLIDCICII